MALSFSLVGRLDTVSAPQLETEIKEYIVGINCLILDFADISTMAAASGDHCFIGYSCVFADISNQTFQKQR